MKLIEKIIVTGTLTLETGLHIGGSKSSLEIGGIDSPVIKTAKGVPYIPGSSLKGKLRSLLAKKEGALEIKNESVNLKKLFGFADNLHSEVTRLFVRDCFMNINHFNNTFEDTILDLEYTEEKIENVINRLNGSAENPRHIERVPAGAQFTFELVLNIYEGDINFYEIVKSGLKLLEDDYLGGSGSRGYGKISIDWENVKIESKKIEFYSEN